MSNIEISQLTFGYNEELIFDKAAINIDQRWHLGLVGRNGRGKTTLLNLLQGKNTVRQFAFIKRADGALCVFSASSGTSRRLNSFCFASHN